MWCATTNSVIIAENQALYSLKMIVCICMRVLWVEKLRSISCTNEKREKKVIGALELTTNQKYIEEKEIIVL